MSALSLAGMIGFFVVWVMNAPQPFWALAIVPFALKAIYDLWKNPTYGVEVNDHVIIILPKGPTIELSAILHVNYRHGDDAIACVVHLKNGKKHKISTDLLHWDHTEFAEVLEERNITVKRPWAWPKPKN
ncbi:hypothetical protein L0664_15460 [Octadecabacter sp. G9-8]|uniref:Uncharacterized protein n=1 Tax=Octadecabacter dasysiphoniae TaxID=2909341 RepID=A0ABS9CYX1_9RHOB|nr:hypothetical protein [Octadecabacter dasysiphoniae]MCF2872472.1 hypothetical protein [Octadecabacter dasysiphoniae]